MKSALRLLRLVRTLSARGAQSSQSQMVLILEREGLTRCQLGMARCIEVLVAPQDLPVLHHSQPVKTSVPGI